MTAKQLTVMASAAISLICSYIPGVKDWYEALTGDYKRMLMGAAIVLVAAGAFGLSCAGILSDVTCSQNGAVELVTLVLLALSANQGMYLLTGTRGK